MNTNSKHFVRGTDRTIGPLLYLFLPRESLMMVEVTKFPYANFLIPLLPRAVHQR
jgi:hypothetical protein